MAVLPVSASRHSLIPPTPRSEIWLRLFGWTLFAAAFGYTEAVVVVYIRRLLGEGMNLDYRQVFALKHLTLTSVGVGADMARHALLTVERTREAATLLLLAGASVGGGRTWRERGALFLYTFAVWDLAYYLFLIPWTGFPKSLLATDIYFLLPVASYGPIWFPVLIVMPLLLVLSVILMRGRRDIPTDASG